MPELPWPPCPWPPACPLGRLVKIRISFTFPWCPCPWPWPWLLLPLVALTIAPISAESSPLCPLAYRCECPWPWLLPPIMLPRTSSGRPDTPWLDGPWWWYPPEPWLLPPADAADNMVPKSMPELWPPCEWCEWPPWWWWCGSTSTSFTLCVSWTISGKCMRMWTLQKSGKISWIEKIVNEKKHHRHSLFFAT